jgi:1,4-alpha-glucan branching enzyme
MGNEFGHPEWIDFPRAGNNWSYQHCRRQWNLVDDPHLHYARLAAFEAAMLRLEEAYPWLPSRDCYVSLKHEADKVLVFDRGTAAGPLLFVFNFHASASYTGYRIGAPAGGDWELALDSDDRRFSGHGRLRADTVCPASGEPWHDRPHSLLVYSPCRSAQVYRRRAAAPPSA